MTDVSSYTANNLHDTIAIDPWSVRDEAARRHDAIAKKIAAARKKIAEMEKAAAEYEAIFRAAVAAA